MNTTSKFKIKHIGIIVLVILVLVFTLQNIDRVTVSFLWFEASMSRAVLVIALLVIGFILGKLSHFSNKAKTSKIVSKKSVD